MIYNFQNTYTKLSSKLFQKVSLPDITNPKIILINSELMQKLGVNYSQNPKQLLDSFEPFAQAYAGHQFGYFTMLGDGRAMILGEHITANNQRFDIQLKGSGITPYSRGGDGKAAAASMIREYLYSYAMKNLGVKTSESLAVISTNEKVLREKVHDGAILIRVMDSHIRFGTFEYVSKFCTLKELKEFTDYVIERHYPKLINSEKKYLKFFQNVVKNTADMVVDWYRVGFIHGVMNTDNMSITGQTFDYGPCAFLNKFDYLATFSQIDVYKRYSFGNQKDILKWNLNVFAKTILPLFDKDIEIAKKELKKELEKFDSHFERKFMLMMSQKLGIENAASAEELIHAFLHFLERNKADYTNTFLELMYPNSISDELYKKPEFLKLKSELKKVGLNFELMQKVNPVRILRNYLVEEALDEYEKSSKLKKVYELIEAVSSPYTKNDKLKKFKIPPPKEYDAIYKTHCNT